MSEKVLWNACDNCPMRRKINCDAAEVVLTTTRKIPYTNAIGKVLYMEVKPDDPVDYYSFELTDIPSDPASQRIELRPMDTHRFESAAKQAMEAKKLAIEAEGFTPTQDGIMGRIETSMYNIGVSDALSTEQSESLKASLARIVEACEGPVKGNTDFIWQRRKCGADILGRTLSRNVMQKRIHDAELLKSHGMLLTSPEVIGHFKPIR